MNSNGRNLRSNIPWLMRHVLRILAPLTATFAMYLWVAFVPARWPLAYRVVMTMLAILLILAFAGVVCWFLYYVWLGAKEASAKNHKDS